MDEKWGILLNWGAAPKVHSQTREKCEQLEHAEVIQLPFSPFCKHSSNVSIYSLSLFFFLFSSGMNQSIVPFSFRFVSFLPLFHFPSLSTFYPFSMALGTVER